MTHAQPHWLTFLKKRLFFYYVFSYAFWISLILVERIQPTITLDYLRQWIPLSGLVLCAPLTTPIALAFSYGVFYNTYREATECLLLVVCCTIAIGVAYFSQWRWNME